MDRRRRKEPSGSDATTETIALHIDEADARATLGGVPLRLSPRAFCVLAYLARHAGRLVDKFELHRAVWRGAIVGDGALVVCIRELRMALDDDARRPRFIETVHRRGYRYIGSLMSQASPAQPPQPSHLIDRVEELGVLRQRLALASAGTRQVLFVTGEPGIGKTTLVDTFLSDLMAGRHEHQAPLLGRGQCVGHHGAHEAYLPIIEALDELRRAHGPQVEEILEREAPAWLVHLPGVGTRPGQDEIMLRAHGATQARMLRELCHVLERLAARHLVVLVLEDLHWSDPSTSAALEALARRDAPARLLVIGTYRHAELSAKRHPLWSVRAELLAHGRCFELRPRPWSGEGIASFLASVSDVQTPPANRGLTDFLFAATGGNPLFVAALVDELRAAGSLRVDDHGWQLVHDQSQLVQRVPPGIRALFVQLGDRLDNEARDVLLVASVAGNEFSAAVVAAALERSTAEVERVLETLATDERFVRRIGIESWPDLTIAARYAFLHAMHRQSWFEQVTPAALQGFRRRMGLRLESSWGARAHEIATELAGHFVDGRDLPRAAHYLRLAGASAARRSAHLEAVQLLSLGLELVGSLPSSHETQHEAMLLQTTLGPVLMASRGYAAPEVEQTYSAARDLSLQVGATPQLFQSLYGLWAFYVVRPRHNVSLRIAQRLAELATTSGQVEWRIEACWAHGVSAFLLGDLDTGHDLLAEATVAYRSARPTSLAYEYGHDPGVSSLSFGAITSWHKGLLDSATRNTEEALEIAQRLGHPYSLAYALNFGAWIHLLERRDDEALRLAQAGLGHCLRYQIPLLQAMCEIFCGVARARKESDSRAALAQVATGIDAYRQSGGECMVPHFLALFADACGATGEYARGWSAIEEASAIMSRNDERWCESEILRVRAILKWRMRAGQDVEVVLAELLDAATCAERRNESMSALRSALDYAAIMRECGRGVAGTALLARVYAQFEEGFESDDLRHAARLLQEIAA